MTPSHASNSPTDEPQSYVAAWIAALLLILVFILGLLMFPPVFETSEEATKPSDGILFIGRFHPIVVHLPIGSLMLLVLFELVCLTRRGEEKFGAASLLTLLVGSAGSVAAVLVGILLSREGGYEGGNFTLHQAIGIGGTAGILIALTLRISAMGSGHGGMMDCYRIIFFLSLSFIGLGAHFGGNMTQGNTWLTKYAPPAMAQQMTGLEKWMLSLVEKQKEAATVNPPSPTPPTKPDTPNKNPAPTPAPTVTPTPPSSGDGTSVTADDTATVFQNVLMPLLDAKCNKCHNEEKSKGDLRMDTHELLLKGGEGEPGKTVVPGKPDESLAITRIKLPLDDDEHMPPEGKDQIKDEETALLHWWIKEGASATLKVKDAKFPPEMKPLVESLLKK